MNNNNNSRTERILIRVLPILKEASLLISDDNKLSQFCNSKVNCLIYKYGYFKILDHFSISSIEDAKSALNALQDIEPIMIDRIEKFYNNNKMKGGQTNE